MGKLMTQNREIARDFQKLRKNQLVLLIREPYDEFNLKEKFRIHNPAPLLGVVQDVNPPYTEDSCFRLYGEKMFLLNILKTGNSSFPLIIPAENVNPLFMMEELKRIYAEPLEIMQSLAGTPLESLSGWIRQLKKPYDFRMIYR